MTIVVPLGMEIIDQRPDMCYQEIEMKVQRFPNEVVERSLNLFKWS
jgi:hypothetical protein